MSFFMDSSDDNEGLGTTKLPLVECEEDKLADGPVVIAVVEGATCVRAERSSGGTHADDGSREVLGAGMGGT